MSGEILFFLQSVASGALLAFIYDILRCIRLVWKHGRGKVIAEDLFYWIGAGIYLFYRIYQGNDGRIRGYIIAGIVLGMWNYRFFFSRYFIKIVHFLLKRVKMLLGIPERFIVFVLKRLKFYELRGRIISSIRLGSDKRKGINGGRNDEEKEKKSSTTQNH